MWDLKFAGDAPALVPLPGPLYADRLPTSKWVTPRPDLRFEGAYQAGGRRVEVSDWRGMQGHNWGRRHAHAYGWGHCNVWDTEELVFEGITVQLAPRAPRITLLMVRHAGVEHAFVLPRCLLRARGEIGARSWAFRAEQGGARLSGRFWADTGDFVGLHYENPDGAMTYCLNSKLARGELSLESPGRPPVSARTNAAALEIATRDPGHGVPMLA